METWGLELRSSVLPEGAWRVLPLWGSVRAGFRFANPSLERQALASGWGAPALRSVLTFTRAQAPTKGLLKCKYVGPVCPRTDLEAGAVPRNLHCKAGPDAVP